MKNMMGKSRSKPGETPYLRYETPDGAWQWDVLKSWQGDDRKQYARWFCRVRSPFVGPEGEMGDVYVAEIVEYARLTYIDPDLKEAGYVPVTRSEVVAPTFF